MLLSKLTDKQFRRVLKYVPNYGTIAKVETLPSGGVLLVISHREGSGNDPEDWFTVTTQYKFSGPSMRACRIQSIEEERVRDDEC
jgi:hypothetical protein